MKRAREMLRWACLLLISYGFLGSAPSADAADPVTLAVAEFDYVDSSGEPNHQSEAPAQRLQDFARLIRDQLSTSGGYQVVDLRCPQPRCSVGAMDPKSLIDAAHQSGARLLLYGGIHKMSTLVQFGKAQVLDLQTDKLVYDRTITFRGDNDEAWKRAGEFLAQDLLSQDLPPAP